MNTAGMKITILLKKVSQQPDVPFGVFLCVGRPIGDDQIGLYIDGYDLSWSDPEKDSFHWIIQMRGSTFTDYPDTSRYYKKSYLTDIIADTDLSEISKQCNDYEETYILPWIKTAQKYLQTRTS